MRRLMLTGLESDEPKAPESDETKGFLNLAIADETKGFLNFVHNESENNHE